MKLIGCAMLLAAFSQAPCAAQQSGAAAPRQIPAAPPPQESLPQQRDDVVVVGRAPDAVDRYVEQLTQARPGRQVARWNRPACLRLPGLDKSHEAYVFERMTAAVRPLKIVLRGGNCLADIMIVFTRDPDRVATFVVRRFPRLFQDTSQGVLFLEKMRADLLRPRPVRWVNASRAGPARGGEFYDGVNSIYTASRLEESTRENAYHSLAIVDLGGMDHLTWAQLVDYLVMVTMANPLMDARYGEDTIMSMFRLRDEGSATPPGLTADDQAFLTALYAISPAATASAVRTQIRSAVARAPSP